MKNRNHLLLNSLAIVSLGAASSAFAGTTWDGGGADTNINTQNNWNDNLNPTLTGGGSTLTFGTGGSTATINTNVNVAGIVLNRDANFEIANGAGSLTIGTGGITMTLPSTTARTHTISESSLILGGSQTWAVTNNTGTAQLNVSSSIDDGASTFAITKTGTGTLVLSGDNSFGASGSNGLILGNNTNSSGSPTDFGVIRLAHNNAAGLGRIAVFGGYQDSQLELSNNITVSNRIELYGRQGYVDRVSISSFSGTNTLSGDWNLTANGSSINIEAQSGSKLIINGNTPTGATGRTLTLMGAGEIEFSKVVNGSQFSSVRTVGAGLYHLTQDNAYAGTTTVDAGGTLRISHANALGTAGSFSSRTTINTGGTLEIATDTSIANEFLDVATNNTGAVVVNRATAGAGITQSTGTTYLGSTSALNVTQGSNVTSGTATLGIASVILASGSVGTGTLNSDTAAISVTGSVSSGVNFSKTLALTGSHAASEISGAISNGLATGDNLVSLTKSGSGTWTISNSDNSYTGTTTISGGKLVINGNISTSSTTVQNNGTLAGIGTVGAVNVETGGRLAIGNSTGTMTFAGDLTLGLNSISDFEINGFGIGEYDLARARVEDPQITQTVNFNSGILNLLFQSGFNTEGSVKIFDFDAYDGIGFSAVNVTGLADGYSASFNTTNGIVTVIPEPDAAMLVGGLGLLALLRRRRAS